MNAYCVLRYCSKHSISINSQKPSEAGTEIAGILQVIKLRHTSSFSRRTRYNFLAKYFVTRSDWFMVLVILCFWALWSSVFVCFFVFLERTSLSRGEGNHKQALHTEPK